MRHKTQKIIFGLFSLSAVVCLSGCLDDVINPVMDDYNQGCPDVIGATNALRCSVAADNDAPACFVIENQNAKMFGVIGSEIEFKVDILVSECPSVRNIQLIDVPGSEDDEANLNALLRVYEAGLNTELLSTSRVESGGTDFFLAGNKRKIATGARVAVHSWAEDDFNGDTVDGRSFPNGHEKHQSYIECYMALGMSRQSAEDFYYFTLDAAPANEMHYMTNSELSRFGLER